MTDFDKALEKYLFDNWITPTSKAVVRDGARWAKEWCGRELKACDELRKMDIQQINRLQAKLDKAVECLKKCKGPMKYAYEDHVDEYYINCLRYIEKTLSELEADNAGGES